jgi:hypothetical protein
VLENDCLIGSCNHISGTGDNFPESVIPNSVDILDMRDYVYIYSYKLRNTAWSSILHHSILKNFRFSSIKISEDVASMHNVIYAARNKKYAITNQRLYYYYQRPDSLFNDLNSNHFLLKDAFFEAIQFWQEKREPEIEESYWQCCYSMLIDVVIETSRVIPQYKEKISKIKEWIKNGVPRASYFGNEHLLLSSHSKENYYELINSKKKYILYGLGKNGTYFLSWLKYFKINVCEIFDKKADNTKAIDDIPIRQAYTNVSKDTVVIISIEDIKIQIDVRNMLREIGYDNFINCQSIRMILRYAAYEKFLPFLL